MRKSNAKKAGTNKNCVALVSGRRVSALDIQLGQRLRTVREDNGLSQQNVAAQIGISFQQIQKYEKGENRVSAIRLIQLCHVYKKPYGYFLDGLVSTGDSVIPHGDVQHEDTHQVRIPDE